MNKILIKLIAIFAIGSVIWYMQLRIDSLNKDLSISVNNEKAYELENSSLEDQNIVFKYTINKLESSKDSVVVKMNEHLKSLKIKDKNIQALQYQLQNYNKIDSIIVRDTIFRDPDFKLDTCIITKWDKSCISLHYPNKITINNSYSNEQFIALSYVKEPIKPKKWFLTKLLARKHIILTFKIENSNKNINVKEKKYIEIIN